MFEITELYYLIDTLHRTENFKTKAFMNIFEYLTAHVQELCLLFDDRMKEVIVKLANSSNLFEGADVGVYMKALSPFLEHVRETAVSPIVQDQTSRLSKYVSFVLARDLNLAEINSFDDFNAFLNLINE